MVASRFGVAVAGSVVGSMVGLTSTSSLTLASTVASILGVGPACPPPQPAATKIDTIPAISRPTLNNFIYYPLSCAVIWVVPKRKS